MLATLEEFVRREVLNHSIYVWGASGQLCKDVDEAWIRKQEARNDGGKHADDAVKAWKEVMASPYKEVARCFDCSGYVSYCLIQAGLLDHRRDCDGLFDRCNRIYEPENGCLLFRVSAKNPSDETHVGFYFDGFQYHSKGRKYGVCCERFKKSYWHGYGWWKKLPHGEPSGDYFFVRQLKYGCEGQDVVELKKLLISHGFGKGLTVNTNSSPNFRSTTRRRVKEFQRSAKIKVDGIAGHDTIVSLGGVWLGE